MFADASGRAHAFHASFGHLRGAVDQIGQRGVATGQAVQLGAAFVVGFAIAGALTLSLHRSLVQGDVDRSGDGGRVAVGGGDANTLGVFQVSFLAEAADDALSGADRARVRVGARGRAGGAAGAEDFVVTAFLDWWEHHERRNRRDRVDLGALDSGDAMAVVADVIFLAGAAGLADEGAHGETLFAGAVAALALTEFLVGSALLGRHGFDGGDFLDFGAFAGGDAAAVLAEVSLFASAAGDADAGAHRVGLLAGAIAAFALTVFFVVAAERGRHRHGFGGGDAAAFRRNAHAVFVFQVAGFAEASDDALERAQFGRARVGAGRGAGGTARHEDFVFFACRDLRWVGEEHVGLRGFALVVRHAKAVSVSQMSFLAEAADDAVLGADRARMGVLAVRGAGRAAGVEFLVGWARRDFVGQGELHGDFVVGSGIAFVREHAFALSVLQVSLLTETADDALKGTPFGLFRISAIRDAGGSTGTEFLVHAALGVFRGHGKSRCGDSGANGANAEQQRESKAKGHR